MRILAVRSRLSGLAPSEQPRLERDRARGAAPRVSTSNCSTDRRRAAAFRMLSGLVTRRDMVEARRHRQSRASRRPRSRARRCALGRGDPRAHDVVAHRTPRRTVSHRDRRGHVVDLRPGRQRRRRLGQRDCRQFGETAPMFAGGAAEFRHRAAAHLLRPLAARRRRHGHLGQVERGNVMVGFYPRVTADRATRPRPCHPTALSRPRRSAGSCRASGASRRSACGRGSKAICPTCCP